KIAVIRPALPNGSLTARGRRPKPALYGVWARGRGDCMWPRWTMTLALPKTGLLPDTTGDLFLADIGIPQKTYQRTPTKYVSPCEKGYWMRLAALRHNETARVTPVLNG